MKGLILSGGHGVRLRPLTYSNQKQLIPIANKPILFYCIEDLIDAGIRNIAIIVGPNKEQVIKSVQSVEWDADIRFISQDAPRGLAHAVKISRDFINGDKFVMYLGDNLLKGGSTEFVKDFLNSGVDASLLLTEVEDPSQYGVALVDEQEKVIIKLLEKPKNPPSNLSIVGIYGLTPVIFEAIENIQPSWRGELEITDALHWLIEQGYTVRYKMVEGWWKDTGQTDDLIHANRLVLQDIVGKIKGEVKDTEIEGNVVIGENTIVSDHSCLRGPLIIGEDCTITHSHIGPYTSIGRGCTISHSEIENSIVMEDTNISHVGCITESLIGKNVTVNKEENYPHKKFVLGDSSEVQL